MLHVIEERYEMEMGTGMWWEPLMVWGSYGVFWFAHEGMRERQGRGREEYLPITTRQVILLR